MSSNFEPIHNARINNIKFGAISLTGALAKDSYIEATPTSELTSQSQDAGGYSTSISILSDTSGTIVIQLQSQSVANVALMNIVRNDRNNGTKTIANIDIDATGTLYLYDYIGCYISSRPVESKSMDMADSTTTWTFYCADMKEKDLDGYGFNSDLKSGINGSVEATLETSFTF